MDFDNWADFTNLDIEQHKLSTIEVKGQNTAIATNEIAQIVPSHYIDLVSLADTLDKLGKPAAAKKLRIKLPQKKSLRSGDLGEILATEYINTCTAFEAPIKKLRWHDHREMAMRGDDVIGLERKQGRRLRFLKTEAKSRASLSSRALNEARAALDADDDRPAPHALAFLADRLREMGNTDLADEIDEVQYKQGISARQMEHLLFTFSGRKPENLQKTAIENYTGAIKQHGVGIYVRTHQQLISDVYDAAKDFLDA